ncbi:hypothetical protein MSAN_02296300 [Mycena sanguinolenta]|uniref:Uncharacterized protein n=1 Tax=Mycena sanguinolenta TaxID=230812 RepID=A0A8H6X8A9_9AGAR|nr:hypothetical protein MSAN_02296300 [Mycena sanguinolenta]
MPASPREIPSEILNYDVHSLLGAWACIAGETFLYGAYLIMIALYVHVLRKRGLGRSRFLAFATIALFVLCTAHCALVLAVVAKQTTYVLGIHGSFTAGGLSAAANAVIYIYIYKRADGIFIFRCYAIWNFQIKIILFPIFLTLGVAGCIFIRHLFFINLPTGIGYFNVFSAVADTSKFADPFAFTPASFNLSILISLFTTFILMGLTVGRIWLLARSARRVFGAQMASILYIYYTVCAMILESGALYLCGGITFIVLDALGPFTVDSDAVPASIVLAQLVGIAPTIIALRVALGQSVENMDSFVVPRSRMHSSFHHEIIPTAVDLVVDEVLYIRPESVKVEGV